MRAEYTDGDYKFEYFVYGRGPKILFAFHGFDNDAQEFEPLARWIGDTHTIVAVNLLFHGESTTPEKVVERGMSHADFIRTTEKLMTFFPAETYELMGFSLGGRMALYITQFLGPKVSRLILLAPDGLKSAGFYRFATSNSLGHTLFKRVVNDPGRFVGLAKALGRMGLLSEKKVRFAKLSLETPKKRNKVYNAWMVYRHILPDLETVKLSVKDNKIDVQLFFGKFDVLMPPELGKEFSKTIESNCSIHVIETGHQLLKEKILEKIGRTLV
jgi:pimeloyl-ACP methyl ester carboxylesterase